MSEIVFFLEERSAGALIEGIIERLIDKQIDIQYTDIRYIFFDGKQDLDKNIEKKIQGYRVPDAQFIILRDQDNADCKTVKADLSQKIPTDKKDKTTVRIACCELESFYLGDLAAVEKGLKISNLSKKQNKSKYRNPDALAKAKQELKRLTNRKYQQIAGSRAIAQHLDLCEVNKSGSFNALLKTIKLLVQENSTMTLKS